MSLPFALSVEMVPSDAASRDFADTFTVVPSHEPVLSPAELGVAGGDGVFESIGVIDAHAQEVAAHLERLAHSAALCDLPEPHPAQWRQAIALAAAACPEGESAMRLIVRRRADQRPSAWVTAQAAPDFSEVRTRGVRAVTLDRGYDSGAAQRAPWLLLGAKTLSYAVNLAALREARRRGADEALFVTSDGIVLEAPTASLVLRLGGRFVTAEPTGGVLHGTTQLSVFSYLEGRGLETAYAQIPAADLRRADAAWLLSSIRLAVPITEIDGAPVPVDPELTAALNRYLLSPRD